MGIDIAGCPDIDGWTLVGDFDVFNKMTNCKFFFENSLLGTWPVGLGVFDDGITIQCGIMGPFKCYIVTNISKPAICNYMRKYIAETPASHQPWDNLFITMLEDPAEIKDRQQLTGKSMITINGGFLQGKCYDTTCSLFKVIYVYLDV